MNHNPSPSHSPAARPRSRLGRWVVRIGRGLALASLGLVGGGFGPEALGQLRSDQVPRQLEGVGVDQRIGEGIPLDIPFLDADGKPVQLGDYFQSGRPVLLTLNYSNCPQLCILQLDELSMRIGGLDWNAGAEFQVVTVSIDPTETPEQARRKRDLYQQRYNRPGTEGGWEFLVGQQEQITALAEAVGFRYRFDPETGEFAHDAAVMVLTPSGVISRYVFGVMFDPVTLRLAMVEASEGKLGTIADSIMMLCFQYDPMSGSYVMAAQRVMAIGGGVSALALACFLWFLSRYRPGGGRGPTTPREGGKPPGGTSRTAESAQAV